MAAKSKNKLLVRLVSTAKTGFFKVVRKNRKNNDYKIEKKCYDPVVRKHVIFKEERMK